MNAHLGGRGSVPARAGAVHPPQSAARPPGWRPGGTGDLPLDRPCGAPRRAGFCGSRTRGDPEALRQDRTASAAALPAVRRRCGAQLARRRRQRWRSASQPQGVALLHVLKRGRERWASDERILGSSAFVQEVVARSSSGRAAVAMVDVPAVVQSLCQEAAQRSGVAAAVVRSRTVRRPVVRARALVCVVAVRQYGLSLSAVARCLGVSAQSVLRGVALGERLLAEDRTLSEWVNSAPETTCRTSSISAPR